MNTSVFGYLQAREWNYKKPSKERLYHPTSISTGTLTTSSMWKVIFEAHESASLNRKSVFKHTKEVKILLRCIDILKHKTCAVKHAVVLNIPVTFLGGFGWLMNFIACNWWLDLFFGRRKYTQSVSNQRCFVPEKWNRTTELCRRDLPWLF